MKRLDLALSAASLLLPAAAMVGAALALLQPVPHLAARSAPPSVPVKEGKQFIERFSGIVDFSDHPVWAKKSTSSPGSGAAAPEPDEPPPPVPLPPARPPPEPAPEPLPSPWAPSEAAPRLARLHMVAADICARFGGWRVDTGRSWHCAYRRR